MSSQDLENRQPDGDHWLAGARQWLADADPMALVALGFVTLILILAIHSWRHWKKRKKKLREMMEKLGFHEIPGPSAELVPELLLHPNEFEPPQPHKPHLQELRRSVPVAWQGRLGKRAVTLMDVSLSRLRGGGHGVDEDRLITFNRSVIRYSPADIESGPLAADLPPDLLIREQVLLKSQAKHRRSIAGAETFGDHYVVFSRAPEAALAAWLTPEVQAVLGRQRSWSLAVHDGVIFLSRGSNRVEPHRLESFLREGEELLEAFLRRSH